MSVLWLKQLILNFESWAKYLYRPRSVSKICYDAVSLNQCWIFPCLLKTLRCQTLLKAQWPLTVCLIEKKSIPQPFYLGFCCGVCGFFFFCFVLFLLYSITGLLGSHLTTAARGLNSNFRGMFFHLKKSCWCAIVTVSKYLSPVCGWCKIWA